MYLLPRQSEASFKLYHYDPTIGGAVVVSVAFALSTIYHTWQMARTRCWIALPVVVGGFCNYTMIEQVF